MSVSLLHHFPLKGISNKGKKTEDLRLGEAFEPKKVYNILSMLKFTLSESVSVVKQKLRRSFKCDITGISL